MCKWLLDDEVDTIEFIKLLISAGADYKKPFAEDKYGYCYAELIKIVEEMGGDEGVYKARQEFEKGRPGSNTKPAVKRGHDSAESDELPTKRTA